MREIIKAYTTHLGYLYCVECKPSESTKPDPIWSENGYCDGEPCEGCGKPIPEHREAVWRAYERGEDVDLSTDALAELNRTRGKKKIDVAFR